jgi:viroplasmin and RNaseH domain-containing protein
MALGSATRHTFWVRYLLQDILNENHIGLLHCDNQAAIKVSKDDSANKRTRHTNREFCITNDALFKNLIKLIWVPTDKQMADIFTKSLGPDAFCKMRDFLIQPA